ncbi:glutamate synthase large subunit [bacterium]|nr:glutamate synthase large subunit [bacterium]
MTELKYTDHPLPKGVGLYHRSMDKDSCGVGAIANIFGEKSHKIIQDGISILKNLEHRGATGADPKAGDGAGMLLQLPHDYFKTVAKEEGFELPDEGDYGVGMVFMPPDAEAIERCRQLYDDAIIAERQEVLGWRRVPTDNTCLSEFMLDQEPAVYQVFIKRTTLYMDTFERRLYVIRRQIEKTIQTSDIPNKHFFYVCSQSAATIVYKGMFLANQLEQYYLDLLDVRFESALALVHQRYSTNTYPSWGLAQPFRFIAHNGEINALQGNINWTRSRESTFESDYFGEDIKKLLPIIVPDGSDSATFDNFFELLVSAGRSLEHAFMMMIPESWENQKHMSKALRGFYEYHAALVEPWDGPAAIMFSDGTKIGAGLDRNGLRPVRYVETMDGQFIVASEVGVIEVPIENIREKGRLGPGQMIVIDTDEGRVFKNEGIKEKLSNRKPYTSWVAENKISLDDLPAPPTYTQPDYYNLRMQQRVFRYTYEELYQLVKPMAVAAQEPTGSMGNDEPLAVLSGQTKLLFNYFKQKFAQVTNPPIDSIREEMVMSLMSSIGGSYNILDETPGLCRMLDIPHPILTNTELARLRHCQISSFRSGTVDIGFPYKEKSLKTALDELCSTVEDLVDQGHRMIVLSDRCVSAEIAPIPSLLAVGAVHHDLIRKNKRGKIGLIVESGEVREVHHFALLIGYGAGAVNPYLAFQSIRQMAISDELPPGLNSPEAFQNYISAANKGLKKVFSKMGISTLASYQGAQIFEAVGLSNELVDTYFSGTGSSIGGIGLEEIEEDIRQRHLRAFAYEGRGFHKLMTTGNYSWRSQGEYHAYNPETISKLQLATRKNCYKTFKQYTALVGVSEKKQHVLRELLEFDTENVTPVPLEEVEPIESIFKRFVSGAMSIGSISREAHETLAIAMNRIGARSNSGEGGEDPDRFVPDANGDSRRSAIKQVASGRFGVTSHYLVNSDEMQIKIAQGAKPGEGGQLPGFKVSEYIAKIRHTTPGVSLISPPPHHDIYSIEDIAQLIFDLKNANPKGDVNVKLVAETGVGVVAAGVSKARADSVTISGHDGGTGASPASSIKHAGGPWEIGLAETQQALVTNSLRGQIRVQVDGQLKSGRDIVVAALLGADEFGFATSCLIVMGCIMMRKCHLNSCPVGVATQDAELRKNFTGKADFLVNYFTFLATETREYMAQLGFRRFEDMIGQVQLLKQKPIADKKKGKGLNLSRLLVKPTSREGVYHNISKAHHRIANVLDKELIRRSQVALQEGKPVRITQTIRNRNRATGTMLGSEITLRYGAEGLPDNTITINFNGSAGQSFGAFAPRGLTLILKGDANDYTGKGLSGGKIIITPPEGAKWNAAENVITGNVVLYGATSGEAYFCGQVGERFAIRNSGAVAVVEGIGNHGCEYMTGGVVVVLGETGYNFAAGMSGGIAYVYDKQKNFIKKCNLAMVDLEQVTVEEQEKELYSLIEAHFRFTGSRRAKGLLKNWKKVINDFVMVMPIEYRRILAKRFMPE